MSKNIPEVKAWRATFENGERWLVWAPTKYLAKLNLRLGPIPLWGPVKIGRCTSADDRPVPRTLVERI